MRTKFLRGNLEYCCCFSSKELGIKGSFPLDISSSRIHTRTQRRFVGGELVRPLPTWLRQENAFIICLKMCRRHKKLHLHMWRCHHAPWEWGAAVDVDSFSQCWNIQQALLFSELFLSFFLPAPFFLSLTTSPCINLHTPFCSLFSLALFISFCPHISTLYVSPFLDEFPPAFVIVRLERSDVEWMDGMSHEPLCSVVWTVCVYLCTTHLIIFAAVYVITLSLTVT